MVELTATLQSHTHDDGIARIGFGVKWLANRCQINHFNRTFSLVEIKRLGIALSDLIKNIVSIGCTSQSAEQRL